MRGADLDAREVRCVLVLEIDAAGDARCAARRRIGAGALAQAAREVLVLGSCQRNPGLEISRRGFEGEEGGGGEGRELPGFQIVELHKADAWSMRSHDQIALPADRV